MSHPSTDTAKESKAYPKIRCPYCGKKIGTGKSLLGGVVTEWHLRPKGSKAPTIGESNHCLGSGNVTGERL